MVQNLLEERAQSHTQRIYENQVNAKNKKID